jgi:hypothetical protein
MKILRAAVLATVLLGAGLVHADGRRRYHDEAGLWVGLGIFADFVGASLLADLIAPPPPAYTCVGFCERAGYAPPGYGPPDYASPGYGPPGYVPPDYVPPSDVPPDSAPPGYAPPSSAPPDYASPGYGPYYDDIGTRRAADAVWAAPR